MIQTEDMARWVKYATPEMKPRYYGMMQTCWTSTEGFIDDGYLDKELKYARKVLNGEIIDHTLLPWLYTQDSEVEVYQDESSWFKSNPSLGTVKKVAYLRERLKFANIHIKDVNNLVLDINNFVDINNLKLDEQQKRLLTYLQSNFIGFVTDHSGLIVFRNIDRKSDFRFYFK